MMLVLRVLGLVHSLRQLQALEWHLGEAEQLSKHDAGAACLVLGAQPAACPAVGQRVSNCARQSQTVAWRKNMPGWHDFVVFLHLRLMLDKTGMQRGGQQCVCSH